MEFLTTSNDSAFPVPNITVDFAPGLTKREYFAAIALQGILASPHNNGDLEVAARDACKYADALIAALNEQPSPEDF